MRRDWPVNLCDICGSMISHYTRSGTVIAKIRFIHKKACNKPSCLAAIKTMNNPPAATYKKKCKNCTEMISNRWGGGLSKGKAAMERQLFHSQACYFDWVAKHFAKGNQGLSEIIQNINFIPISAVEKFISRGNYE